MKSLCVKTNNSNILKYLLNELKYADINDICFSENEFKNYKNIIIHYTGKDDSYFVSKISSILCFLVIDELEEDLLKRFIVQNYFYLDSKEISQVLSICFDLMADDLSNIFDKKFNILYDIFYDFISLNKIIMLSGFVNFRLKSYFEILEDIISEAMSSYIIEKEYLEFISLLKLYVNSQDSNLDAVHLIYNSSESILLDDKKNIIITGKEGFKAKYLSDISFSSNDYTLNSLLTILPKKIYIHLIDDYIDEFINTILLVFENKVKLCTDCDICMLYKSSHVKDKSLN